MDSRELQPAARCEKVLRVRSDRFARFLPFAGALAGLVFLTGLLVFRNDPPSESDVAATFEYWQNDRGEHQIVALILTPLMGFLLLFYGAGLHARLQRGGDHGHAMVAFGGALLAAGTFALVGMLEAAMTNAAKEGNEQAVYTLNQLHSYDWLAWNAAFAALLLATGLGALRNGMFPRLLAWATIVIGASLLTPLGFFGFITLPFWLVVTSVWLTWRDPARTPRDPALAA